ncbi:MAG: peptidylprolyl isomerase [Actinomycetota bacterium]|nr:peptidylprolyl isomerase [Actinomycetota bacterium]
MRWSVLLALTLALAGCGGKTQSAGGDTSTDSTPPPPPATTPPPAGSCKRVSAPKPKADGGQKAPKETLDPEKTYTVAIQTNCGSFTITLDQNQSPRATAAFVALANAGFFDQTTFHRIVPGFVIQGGDPTGTGRGGPGFSTLDPPRPTARYTLGVVAMAKTGAEPPGTAGSQFFVVTADDAGLPPDYAVIGAVTNGLPVVLRIGALGNAMEQPTQPVVISRTTVAEA